MSNGVDNNELWKKLQETVMQNSWLQGLYGEKRADQQNAIKGVFTVVADNNLSEAERNALLRRAETLQETVERLEAKMAVLEEALAKNQEEINRHAAEITNLVTQSERQSKIMQENQVVEVGRITKYCFEKLKNGTIEHNQFSWLFESLLENNDVLNADKRIMDGILADLSSKQAEVANIVASADKWISQRNLLEAQYGATKSTYDLIQMTASRIGKDSGNYTNKDIDTNKPVYSPEKIALISKFSENPSVNVEAGENTNYVEGSQAPTPENISTITEKYKGLLDADATKGVDPYTMSNIAVQNLKTALDMGLIEDLCSAGLDVGQAQTFVAEHFAAAGIKRTDNGLQRPIGHGAEAQKVYKDLSNRIKNYGSAFQGTTNTWNPDKGNTIGSNKQIASLAENYQVILGEMKNAGFTFKEAMFALFDSKYGIFKDSGVVYDVTRQGEKPNYFIEYAGKDKGDNENKTAEMYQSMAQLIYENWGVKPFCGANAEEYDENYVEPSEVPTEEKLVDPLSFDLGDKNNQFTFIIDRNKDGAFNDNSEFVGASSRTNWFEDMKSFDKNGDGILDFKELRDVMLLNTRFNDDADVQDDNNEYTPDKVATDKGFERNSTTRVDYRLVNAADLGIESINLNDVAQVGVSTGKFDANGAEIFEDSFSFTMTDGKQITAMRKDETDSYMKAVYGNVYGKAVKLGFSDVDVQNVLDKDYGEFDKFNNKYSATFANIQILKNAGSLLQQAKELYQRTMNNIIDIHTAGSSRANNDALSYALVPSWNSIEDDVKAEVKRRGLPENDSQVKGIYIMYIKANSADGNSESIAEEVADRYEALIELEAKIETDKEINKNAWKTISLANKAGVPVVLSEVIKWLEQGELPEDIVARLKEASYEIDTEYVYQEIGFDSEREQEIYDSFNAVFNEAGHNEKVVEALAMLCELQQENKNFMINESGEELAKEIMKRMGLEAVADES